MIEVKNYFDVAICVLREDYGKLIECMYKEANSTFNQEVCAKLKNILETQATVNEYTLNGVDVAFINISLVPDNIEYIVRYATCLMYEYCYVALDECGDECKELFGENSFIGYPLYVKKEICFETNN